MGKDRNLQNMMQSGKFNNLQKMIDTNKFKIRKENLCQFH